MPKQTKKFIDKKKAVTFQLVHRSQQDPLIADENAPQRVLVEQDTKKDKEKRLDEQHKYGIYYDDDCNYLQYLKSKDDLHMEWPDDVDNVEENLKEKVKLQLPSSVFASVVEEEVGMLNKAAPVSGPQLHLDPDLVAAMDEDFDYNDPDNQLEDNFIELANGFDGELGASGKEDEYYYEEYPINNLRENCDEEFDEVSSLPDTQFSFNEEETKSRFTNYSMSSSVIKRNEQLTLLDDRFEQIYSNYDDNEIGALDCDEIEGYVKENSNILLQLADQFKKECENEQLDKDTLTTKILQQLEIESDDDEENEKDLVYMKIPEKEKWDCESILSTYSNIYNHPKLIEEPKMNVKIKLNKRTGIPMNVLGTTRLTQKALNKLNQENDKLYNFNDGPKSTVSVLSQLSALSIRPKDETSDERNQRKKLLKEYRKERRLEKKLNSLAFKEEKKRQIKFCLNNKNNLNIQKLI